MNLSALPEMLLTWVKTQGAALLQGDRPPPPVFQTGQQYEGKVLDNLPNGRHLVNVAGQHLDMGLPANTKPGDTVKLTFLGDGPRPTFQMQQVAQAANQQVQISNTAQQVNALMRMTQVPTAAPALTSAARVAVPGNVTAAAPGAANTARSGIAPPPPAQVASLSTAVQVASTLAAAVPSAALSATAVSFSMAPAAARPIVTNLVLLQEVSTAVSVTPGVVISSSTTKLGVPVEGLRAAVPANTTLSAGALVEAPEASRGLLPQRLSQTMSESGLFYESHLARWSRGHMSLEALLREPQARLNSAQMTGIAELGGMPEEAARLAGRQLHMLEGAPFQWLGYAWPGQWMEWMVQERPDSESREGVELGAEQWATELRLTLPRMGAIHARVGLNGTQVSLKLATPEDAIRSELRTAMPALLQSLQAAGLEATSVSVGAVRDHT